MTVALVSATTSGERRPVSNITGTTLLSMRPTAAMAVKLKFDAVDQSLLPLAADVLPYPIPAFGKQVLRFPAPVLVFPFAAPEPTRHGALADCAHDAPELKSRVLNAGRPGERL
jgi:hypothetical protein